jgi:hypothetical protein
MNNTVIGVAVLDRTKITAESPPKYDRLHLLCRYADGTKHHSELPVRPKGTAEPAHAWEYDIIGEQIHVSPSLKITTTKPSADGKSSEPVELFHSSGSWNVPFKEFVPGEYVQAYDLFKSLNPP